MSVPGFESRRPFHRIALIAIALPLLLAACTSRLAGGDGVRFVVVRHAEKVDDGSRDPALSQTGRDRAAALVRRLADTPVVAVYASGFHRTRDTAAPTAQDHGVAITTYDANEPAATFAARLRRAHRSGSVLVVGHSNTAPDIAAALCGCDVPAMDEDEYTRLMTIHVGRNGGITLLSTTTP
ncbi:MAG TPA: phosphoglycerate mutase family protein [Lysobacter sp.]|nr:phosphoglycerate mutase family protein [Lysobacter sp.]